MLKHNLQILRITWGWRQLSAGPVAQQKRTSSTLSANL
jgi:hypothetical protein